MQQEAGVPIEPGPADRAFRERVRRRRLQDATLGILGAAGEAPELRYVWTRVVEIVPRSGRGRRGRYHVIRVESPVPLAGEGIEELFRLGVIDFRRLIGYSGPIWWADPLDRGLPPPAFYYPVPFDFFDEYDEDIYFEAPEELADNEDYYPDT